MQIELLTGRAGLIQILPHCNVILTAITVNTPKCSQKASISTAANVVANRCKLLTVSAAN